MLLRKRVETVTYAVELFDFVQDLSRRHLMLGFLGTALRIGVLETPVWSLRTSFQNNSAGLPSARNFRNCRLWIIKAAHRNPGQVPTLNGVKLPVPSFAPKQSKAAQPRVFIYRRPADSNPANDLRQPSL